MGDAGMDQHHPSPLPSRRTHCVRAFISRGHLLETRDVKIRSYLLLFFTIAPRVRSGYSLSWVSIARLNILVCVCVCTVHPISFAFVPPLVSPILSLRLAGKGHDIKHGNMCVCVMYVFVVV